MYYTHIFAIVNMTNVTCSGSIKIPVIAAGRENKRLPVVTGSLKPNRIFFTENCKLKTDY
jgi:hypothetical protein